MSVALTFTQGLILGQLSVVLFIGAFIKFFIFGEAPLPSRPSTRPPKHIRSPSLHSLASSKSSPPQTLRNKTSTHVLRPVPTNAADIASILRKTYYQIPNKYAKNNHSTHQPESLDWFNVLIAQTIAQYRQTAYNLRDGAAGSAPSIIMSLENAINDPEKRPSFLDTIKITEISMGEEFPIFSNVRVIAIEDDASASTGGRLQALLDVDLSDDNLTLAIETALILNYPKPFSAVLPVALAVSVVRFSGTLSISFVPATSDDPAGGSTTDKQPPSAKPKTNMAFSFLPDYRLDLSVRSLIGSRTRLQDVPKIAQLVEARVQAWFEERVVEPRVQVVPLPGLWPRMGKVRVREGPEDDRPSTSTHDESRRATSSKDSRSEDNFPSQEETEKLFEGLRWRNGHMRSNSQVIEDDYPTPQPKRMAMPGSMPGALPP